MRSSSSSMPSDVAKCLFYGSLAVIIVLMVAASVRFEGIYHAWYFILLWAVAAYSGLVFFVEERLWRQPATFGIYCSCLVILAGALVTHLGSVSDTVHLRIGESTGDRFPFELTLDDFTVEYYRGSRAPMDFSSRVTVEKDGRKEPFTISMNHILVRDGYRFYQQSYDGDGRGSVLRVTYDPWGVRLTYAGYLLLLLSLVGFFFQRNTRFREVLKRVSAAGAIVSGIFLSQGGALAAPPPQPAVPVSRPAAPSPRPKVLPKETAAQFGRLHVYYNDRICPLQTLARDYVMKVYGKPRVKGFTAEQVLTGWLFFPDSWTDVPVRVKRKDKGTAKEDEKHFLIDRVRSAEALKIFPCEGVWYSPADQLPQTVPTDQWMFFKKVLSLIGEDIFNNDFEGVGEIVSKIGKYQEKTAADVLPSPEKFRAERIYNRISRPMPLSMFCVTLGIVLFILSGIGMSKGRRTPRWLRRVLALASGGIFLYLTLVLALRWHVAGHVPLASGNELMLSIAWLVMLLTTLSWKKLPILQPFGFILAGFSLLVSMLGMSNPQITPLMPVLSSPLLSIHVSCMMISYTLLGLAALNGLMGLIVPDKAPDGRSPRQELADTGLLILHPAVFLLAVGTFLGAVWANVSWGTYWSWDPKETWALITLLIYSFALQSPWLPAFRRPKFFHLFCIAALLSVLVTYFGVNYLLGGMHSYA